MEGWLIKKVVVILIFALVGTGKMCSDAAQYKDINDNVNKCIAQQGLSKKKINIINKDMRYILEMIDKEQFEASYERYATEIVEANIAKTIENNKKFGEDKPSQQTINEGASKAITSIKKFEYKYSSSIYSCKRFDVDKVMKDLEL